MSEGVGEHVTEGGIWSATTGVAGAPHVVLVHGSLDRSAGMLKLSRRLDGAYHVTRYDRRGYGRSTAAGPFTVDQHVADLVEVIAATGEHGSPRIAVGHSFGGNVALALAARRPDLTAGVVVYESPLPWLDWWPNDGVGGRALALASTGDAAELFMRSLLGDERWERLPPATRAARRAEGEAMVAELRDARRAAPWSPEEIGVPVVAIHGEHGMASHARAMHLLGEWLADVEVHTVPEAGHAGPATHAGAVAALVAGLVERLRAA